MKNVFTSTLVLVALPADSPAGLYRMEVPLPEGKAICGWIVDKDGSTVGVLGFLAAAGRQLFTLAAGTVAEFLGGKVKNAVENVANKLGGAVQGRLAKAGAKGAAKPRKVATPVRRK
jgi:hypothetical protein